MKNNKYLYLLFCLIIIFFTGCDGSDSARKPTEKNETPNQTEVRQKKESWKGGSQKKGGKGFSQRNNKKTTNVRLKKIIHKLKTTKQYD